MKSSLVRLGLVVILAALIVVLVPLNRNLAARANLGQDFLPLWVAARVEFTQDASAYDAAALQAQYEADFDTPVGAVVSEEDMTFSRPLTALFPIAPLAFLSFPVARSLWLTLLELLQPGLFLLSLELSGLRKKLHLGGLLAIVVLSLIWRYGLEAVIGGHPAALQAGMAAAVLAMLTIGQNALAGVFTGLGVMLGEVLAPLGFLLSLDQLRARSWAFVAGAAATFTGGVVSSNLIAGNWQIPWLAVFFNNLGTRGVGSPLAALGPAAVWIPLAGILMLYTLWHWIRLLGRDRDADQGRIWVACLTLTVSFALLGTTHPAGSLLLVPALLLVANSFRDRWGGSGAAMVLAVALVLLVGPWVPLLIDLPISSDGAWLAWLPLTVSLVGLWWTRWWVVRGSELTLTRGGIE